MIDEKLIKRFIEGAKEAFKEVEDPTFTFPMNILSAYELATSIEELLKAQEAEIRRLRLAMLKERETEIQQLRLELDIAKETCKLIKSGGGQFADMPILQSAT